MSRDSLTAVTGRAMQAEKKARHAEWNKVNRGTLEAAGLQFTDKDTVLLFRQEWKPSVDFYPHTGRWKDNRTGKMHRGGARVFIFWYHRQVVSDAKVSP